MDSANTKVDYTTDQEKITSILEEAFPKKNFKKEVGNPQSDGNRMDFVQPYVSGQSDSYQVSDTETVYTMTKDAFAGKGGMKFMGIRFMSIWVFPMAIMGTVMEFLFVGPMKGTNPFG